uniref:Uncharacterized protein n=1 Tax=Zea mays TaxID=4577 RepID=B6UFM2_MAIZE|nr:hypothetical protein [Zea mays]
MVSWRRSASWLSSASRSSLGAAVGGEAKVTPEADPAAQHDEPDEERWSRLLPELLTEIMRRVDAGAERWPPRRDVVVCACRTARGGHSFRKNGTHGLPSGSRCMRRSVLTGRSSGMGRPATTRKSMRPRKLRWRKSLMSVKKFLHST